MEDNWMEYVLRTLPLVYNIEVRTLQKWLNDLQKPLTLKELCAELGLKFEMLNGRGRLAHMQDIRGEDYAVFAGCFLGKCNNSGKIGHKACISWDKDKNKNKEEQQTNEREHDKNIEFFYWKKKGHIISKCFKSKQKEQANSGVEQSSNQGNNVRGNDEKSTTSEIGLGI